MDIYLIRHLPPVGMEGKAYGQLDVDYRKDMLQSSAEHINGILPKEYTIYSSPLTRCKELAESFSNTDILYDNRIKELDFGDWEGMNWADIPKADLDYWMEDYVLRKAPNGESFMDMKDRIEPFWEELKKQDQESTVIVAHGGVIRVLLHLTLQIPFTSLFNIEIEFGKVSLYKEGAKSQWLYINK